MNVDIDEIVTEMVVSDSGTGLSRAEMRQIVQSVIEHLRHEQASGRQRQRDTGVRNRAYDPTESEGGES